MYILFVWSKLIEVDTGKYTLYKGTCMQKSMYKVEPHFVME